jgi:hypothetical protein
MSEIARRMTDLFVEPSPTEVISERGAVFLEQGLIHRTSRNELVRSKAELAIAEKLHAMRVPYVYEQPLQLAGRTRYPDFTIEDDEAGRTTTGSISDYLSIATIGGAGRASDAPTSKPACAP